MSAGRCRGLALAFACAVAPLAASAAGLDFAGAVALALRQNPQILGARARVHQARAALGRAEGARWPTLTASAGVVRTDDALKAFGLKLAQRRATFSDFGAGQFDPANPGVLGIAPTNLDHPAAVDNFSSALEARLPLYTGGRIEADVRAAREALGAARAGDEAARQRVIYALLRAYDGVFTARAFEKVATQALAAARAQWRTARRLFHNGVVVKSDVLSAQVRLASVEVERLRAADASARAMDTLRVALGLAPGAPLELGAPVRVPMPAGRPAGWVAEAQRRNPALRALGARLRAAGAKVRVARAGLYPQIGAMARFDTNDPSPGFGAHGYTVGAELQWNLFDGGVTRHRIDEAQAGRMVLREQLRAEQNALAARIAQRYRASREAHTALASRRVAVRQAEEAARIVRRRYANGIGTLVALQDAQAQLDRARAELVAARQALDVERAGLLLALGRLDLDHLGIRPG